MREFEYLLMARTPLICIGSGEELRIEKSIGRVAAAHGYTVMAWDVAGGATELRAPSQPSGAVAADEEVSTGFNDSNPVSEMTDPHAILDFISERHGRRLWILRDFFELTVGEGNQVLVRQLKSLARKLSEEVFPDGTGEQVRQCIVILGGEDKIPSSLESSTTVCNWPLPTRTEIGRAVRSWHSLSRAELGGEISEIVDAAIGLPLAAIEHAVSVSLAETVSDDSPYGIIDPQRISSNKRSIIEKSGVVQWYPPEETGLDAIGGLENLKEHLADSAVAFTAEYQRFVYPNLSPEEARRAAPRGIFLGGVSGCGKSLAAKAIPGAFGNIPLLRLDLGAVKGGFVGESEKNIRKALELASAVAPAVLWIDEIEKSGALATGSRDGGVSTDQLGTLLTWMQEHAEPVFVVATANDVSKIAEDTPELFRRFDAMFFLDLPHEVERREIAAVTLRKHGRDPDLFDCDAISLACEGFTGSEVAGIFQAGMNAAYRDGRREVETQDIIRAASAVKPMSKTADAAIRRLRSWGGGRMIPASSPPETSRSARNSATGNEDGIAEGRFSQAPQIKITGTKGE